MKKRILLGVTSGIAIYKTLDLVSMLVKNDYDVNVVMTENAKKLINPIIFETLSKNKVYTDIFYRDMDVEVKHIKLASISDLIVLAPFTLLGLPSVCLLICKDINLIIATGLVQWMNKIKVDLASKPLNFSTVFEVAWTCFHSLFAEMEKRSPRDVSLHLQVFPLWWDLMLEFRFLYFQDTNLLLYQTDVFITHFYFPFF